MASGCAYGCVHPWWGGRGSCVEAAGDHPAVCSCDAGYVSQGTTAHPRCVPKQLLVGTYIMFVIVSVLDSVLLGWYVAQYRDLPTRSRSARKTTTRMGALVGFSIYVLGCAFVGVDLAVQAGDKEYLDDGVIQALHIVLLPSIMFGVAMLGECWVMNLPSQLIAPGSLADKLAGAAEKYNAFFVVGCLDAGGVAALGFATFVYPIKAARFADMAMVGGVVIAVTVIAFVAVQMNGYINQANSKASASSSAFYAKAKKSIRQQAATLCGVGIFMVAVTTVRHLTVFGQSTFVLLYTTQLCTGHLAGAIFALGTRFPDSSVARSPNTVLSSRAQPAAETVAPSIHSICGSVPLHSKWWPFKPRPIEHPRTAKTGSSVVPL